MSARPLSPEIRAETLAAWEANGRNQTKAADALGISRNTFQSRLRVALRMAREEAIDPRGTPGFSPVEVTASYNADCEITGSTVKERPASTFEEGGIGASDARDGTGAYFIKGASTYYDRAGNQTGQWVRTDVDKELRLQAILAAMTERAERIEPLPPIPLLDRPSEASQRLLNFLTLTDCHIGMLAWDKEAGADWDLQIAKDTLLRTSIGMLRSFPPAKTCVINQMGDFLHTDGLKPMTPAHGNILDADSRYQKMVGVATDVLEQVIIEAMKRHERVHVIPCEGNHDEGGSVWLRVMFRRIFRDNPRVTVDDSPLPYYAYLHGRTLIGVHHGHLAKMGDLPGIFAGEPRFRPLWGMASRTYIHVGHHHCREVIEKGGAEVERHPTLAASDAYAARGGYIADRRLIGITYDDELGEVGRIVATPETYR